MLWWSWSNKQKWTLIAAMLGVAAISGLLFGWATREWKAALGVTWFLLLPPLVGWQLFIGLWTGRIPARGTRKRYESRADDPVWFWLNVGGHIAVLIVMCWFAFGVATS
ncbi:hypothetical protein [Brevundimonas sp.]|uniref:hypothetical protein n=1 Tax=Brevundimonas sp. TaxID=1871086 RepID=UPI003918A49C